MTPDLKELERLARAAIGWKLDTVVPATDEDACQLGLTTDGEFYPLVTIDCENYCGDSIHLANFFKEANPAVILSLIAELEQAKKDAERYRWLTADHADAEMRDLAEDTGIRLRWIGKGSADAAIDAAIAKGSA